MSNGQQYESYILTNHAKDEVVPIKQEDNEQVEEVYGCQSRPSLVLNSDNQLQEHVKEEVIIKKEPEEYGTLANEDYFQEDDTLTSDDNFEDDSDFCVDVESPIEEWSETNNSINLSRLSSEKGVEKSECPQRSSRQSRAKKIYNQKRVTPGKDPEGEDLTCQACGKTFTCKHSVRIHQRIHTGERPFKCEECGAGFKQSGDLKMHLTIHLGLKPYICEVCSIPFRRRGDMNRHMQVHNGLRPFKCKTCSRDFVRSSHLKKHWEKEHQKPQTKPDQDAVKPVAQCERLNCSMCTKTFKCNRTLREHLRIHSGNKPYKCDYCEKAFFHSGSFYIHKRIHTGERPYPCRLCKKTFIRSCHLKQHVRKSHKELEASGNASE